MQSLALGSNGAHIHRVNFFSFKIEEVHTLATSVEVSQSILNRRMIVWSGWDSSICQNYSKKKKKIIGLADIFKSGFENFPGYRPYSYSLMRWPAATQVMLMSTKILIFLKMLSGDPSLQSAFNLKVV